VTRAGTGRVCLSYGCESAHGRYDIVNIHVHADLIILIHNATRISKELQTFRNSFPPPSSGYEKFIGLRTPCRESDVFQNIGSYFPKDTASYPRKFDSSSTPLLEPQILYPCGCQIDAWFFVFLTTFFELHGTEGCLC
jgi:hypothetical protein